MILTPESVEKLIKSMQYTEQAHPEMNSFSHFGKQNLEELGRMIVMFNKSEQEKMNKSFFLTVFNKQRCSPHSVL